MVTKGPVVYIAAEGENGLKRRFRAWEIRNQQTLDGAALYVFTVPAALCDPVATAGVAEAIQAVSHAFIGEDVGGDPANSSCSESQAQSSGPMAGPPSIGTAKGLEQSGCAAVVMAQVAMPGAATDRWAALL